MNWLAITGLVIALAGIIVLLYFAAPIISAIANVLHVLLKWVSMAPRAFQIFLFVITFGTMAGIIVMLFVGTSVVCTDPSGGLNPKPYDIGITGATVAKALPEGPVDYNIKTDNSQSTGAMSWITGRLASWFLPDPKNLVGAGSVAWGTYFTTSDEAKNGVNARYVANTPVIFMPSGNEYGSSVNEVNFEESLKNVSTVSSDGNTISFKMNVCGWLGDKMGLCYVEIQKDHWYSSACSKNAVVDGGNAVPLLSLQYTVLKSKQNGKDNYAISVEPSQAPSIDVYFKDPVNLCTMGSDVVTAGDGAGGFVNGKTWNVDGKYVAIGGDIGANFIMKSPAASKNLRSNFVTNYVAQQDENLTEAKGDSIITYKCDRDANTTALLAGLDVFNFKTLLIVMVFASIFVVASSLGLFR